jgi:hypothetical protein
MTLRPRIRDPYRITVFTAVVGTFTALILAFQVYTFIQSERAFVFPSKIAFVEPLAIEKVQPILLEVAVHNSGRSPAIIKRLIAFVAHDLPPTPDYKQKSGRLEIAFSPIPPGETIQQRLIFDKWGEDTMIKVRDGQMPFHMFGRIEYADRLTLFQPSRSDFCFVYIANSQDQSRATFRNCPDPRYTNTD